MRQTPELLAATKVAELLGIDRSTWWRWCVAGIAPVPTIKRGRCVRWSRASIEAFVAGRDGVAA